MPNGEHVIEVRHTVDAGFLADVLTTAVEGGIGYWAQITGSKRAPGLDWIEITLIDQIEDDNAPHVVTLADVARAIQLIMTDSGVATHCAGVAGDIARAVAEGDAGHIDAGGADAVVQVAALGDTLYG
jgi:hypothetical protein